MASVGAVYTPPHFEEQRDAVVRSLLRTVGFGHLVCLADEGLSSTPVPFVIDDALRSLRSHLTRANRLWRHAPCDALFIVAVSDAYVSPGWYPSKAEHGRVVPTWNYEVVHLHGRLVVHDDPAWVGEQVRDLTAAREAPMPAPWTPDDAPSDFIDAQLRGIVGIEPLVDRVIAKRKLSQNRSPADRAGVVAGLEGAPVRRRSVADAMTE